MMTTKDLKEATDKVAVWEQLDTVRRALREASGPRVGVTVHVPDARPVELQPALLHQIVADEMNLIADQLTKMGVTGLKKFEVR